MSKIQFWKQFTTNTRYLSIMFLLYSICQRYNFESNLQPQRHNRYIQKAVFDMSKIQFWKQFTTTIIVRLLRGLLYSICQRYNFESNLQLSIKQMEKDLCCIRYVKDTILKAIYNLQSQVQLDNTAVFDMSKIQFWKQFTTRGRCYKITHLLYSICQRYNFESNLQLCRGE